MGMEVGSLRLCFCFLVLPEEVLAEVLWSPAVEFDVEVLLPSTPLDLTFFFFVLTWAGMTGSGVTVRASSGVSWSIQSAQDGNGTAISEARMVKREASRVMVELSVLLFYSIIMRETCDVMWARK